MHSEMKKTIFIFAALSLLFSCTPKEGSDALATLCNVSTVEFEATNATVATVSITSDGSWSVRNCPDWITVTPDKGSGTAELSVSASDNLTGGEVGLPRTGEIIIGGPSLLGQTTLYVSQGGDRYMGVAKKTLAEIAAVADGEKIASDGLAALASTSSALLVSDGSLYAFTDAKLPIGKKATIKGVKKTLSGLPYFTDADILDIADSGSETPAATDITSTIDAFSAPSYVTLAGVATPYGSNITITVSGASKKATVVSPAASLGFSTVLNHNVIVTGYAYPSDGGVNIVAVSVEDKGLAKMVDKVAEWLFDTTTLETNGKTFTDGEPASDGSYTSSLHQAAGDNGFYIDATTGSGRITFVQLDKTEIDTKNYAKWYIGKTGEPYMTGVYVGDYWLFTINLSKTYKAGSTAHISLVPRTSNGCFKYWILEIFDGDAWVPMMETKKIEKEGYTDVSYNWEQVGAEYNQIDADYVLTADTKETLLIRYRVVANLTASTAAVKTTPDGGTIRLSGGTRTSPYVEISYEP